MNHQLQDYVALTASLLKPADQVRADMDKLPDETINLLHCAMGMAGEFLEMKFSKNIGELVKEQSDFLFYLVAAHHQLGIPFPETFSADGVKLDPNVHMMNAMNMEQALLVVLEVTKKEFFYAKPQPEDKRQQRVTALKFLMDGLVSLTGNAGTSLAGLIDVNTAKLTQRYAGTSYSNDAAVSRVDTKEQ